MEALGKFFNKRSGLIVGGLICGCLFAILAFQGNPANMAFCAACFIRDTAGSLKLHNAEAVQYFRPEIVGVVVGSAIMALATREFKSTAGSAPMTRFILGFVMMIGALIFLGCPLRMIIRMSAGDLNAWVGLIGFVLGIATGTFFLKKGFSLGREHTTTATSGSVLSIILIVLLCIGTFAGVFAASTSGPGSKHAPVAVSLIVALIIGAIAQKSRICFAAGTRNAFLMKDFDQLLPILGMFIIMLLYNFFTGNLKFSFDGQPIAHSQHLWNILGLYAVGFGAVLAGGCPLRQMVLAGQGSCDAAVTFLGMLIGAAIAHNFGLVGTAASAASGDSPAVAGGPAFAGQAVLIACIVVLFVIAGINIAKQKMTSSSYETAASVA